MEKRWQRVLGFGNQGRRKLATVQSVGLGGGHETKPDRKNVVMLVRDTTELDFEVAS